MKEIEKQYIAGFFDAEGTIVVQPAPHSRYAINHTFILQVSIGQKDIAYIAGYFDGEGYLCNAIHSEDNMDTGYAMKQNIKIVSNDYDILEKIEKIFHTQNLKAHIRKKKKGAKEVIISSRASVKRFLEIYTPYFWGPKKIQAQIMLNQILPRMEKGEHLTKKGFIEIMGHVDKMNSFKGHNRGKYNQQYFKDIWKGTKDVPAKTINFYTEEEINTIKNMRSKGLFIREIAQKTGRTYGSIRHTLTQISKGVEFKHGRFRIKTK